MKKTSIILIAICSSLALTCFVIFIFLSAVNRNIPQELEYPPGDLSESIFASQGQNMKYVPDAELVNQHLYENTPFSIDVPQTDRANVGDFGAVYRVNEGVYIYTTEIARGTSVETLIKNELSKAVMVDALTEISVVDNLVYEEGYKNGFKADYYIDRLTVSNQSRSASVYLVGYMLTITDEEQSHGYDLFLGIVTAQATTENYAAAKQMLDALVQTFQYDEKRQESMLAKEAEEERRAQQGNVGIETTGDGGDLASYAGTEPGEVSQPDVGEGIPKRKTKAITIDKEYTNVTLYYYYTNTEETVDVVLHDPLDEEEYEPDSVTEGTICFKLDRMQVGKWHLIVTGNPGEESLRVYSESMEEVE